MSYAEIIFLKNFTPAIFFHTHCTYHHAGRRSRRSRRSTLAVPLQENFRHRSLLPACRRQQDSHENARQIFCQDFVCDCTETLRTKNKRSVPSHRHTERCRSLCSAPVSPAHPMHNRGRGCFFQMPVADGTDHPADANHFRGK